MAYTLAYPIPSPITLETVSEGVSSSSTKAMWQDTEGDGGIHLFAGFGMSPYYGHHIKLNTGAHAIVTATGILGAGGWFAFYPTQNKLYIGASGVNGAGGSAAEFDPTNQTLTILDNTLEVVVNTIIGDDGNVYFVDAANGTNNNLYSYDPTGPTWTALGGIPNTIAKTYAYIGVDSGYIYCSAPKVNDSYWTLEIAPIPTSGNPSWTQWEFGGAADQIVKIKKKSGGGWFVERVLSGGTKIFYNLASGGYTEIAEPDEEPTSGSPRYCFSTGDAANYWRFFHDYGWDVDFAELLPIKDIHENSRIKYRASDTGEWTGDSDLSYTGTWIPVAIKGVVPLTGTNLFCISDQYNAAVEIDYSQSSPGCTTYLGSQVISPYTIRKHPARNEAYIGGYTDAILRYLLSASWSLTNANSTDVTPETTPYPAISSPNPFSIYTDVPQLHYRLGIDFDFQDYVWVGGNTTRNSPDYGNVMWYNPIDGTTGYMFPGWTSGILFRNLCACLGRTKILVSDNADSIYRIDAATQTDDDVTINPVGSSSMSYMIEVANDRVFVVNIAATNKVGILQPSTMTWPVSLQSLGVSGQPFGFDDEENARMSWKLELGPDDYVWMFVGSSLYRIDAVNDSNLTFNKVLDATYYGKISFANNSTDLVLYFIRKGDVTDLIYYPGIFTYTADYSRGSYVSLPANDADLNTSYTGDDIADVATDDTDMVAQLATSQMAIHQFKQQINGAGGIITVVAQVTIPCSTSTTYLQIYNRQSEPPAWDTIDSDNATGANTDFTLSATVADLTDYKDENNIVACRVYQEMQ